MQYKFITLGCKVNSYESEAMGEQLKSNGFEHVKEDQRADIVVINTCSVTSVADSKSRQLIRREIKNNPQAIICAVGCYAQMDVESLKSIPGIAIIIGTKNRNKISQYVQQYLQDNQTIVDVDESVLKNYDYEKLSVTSYYEATRAYLKIQDGCNNFCSYCIIPYARGPLRSRSAVDVVIEATKLAQSGYQEIVLTGIHTAGYGQDFQDYKFGNLLMDLCKIKELKRLRISSIEESEIDDSVLEALKNCPIIVDHLHIPLQSGSEAVLKRMHRKYTLDQYRQKIKELRELFPTIAITTDVIVGFPGETEAEFNETKAFIHEIHFAALHVFPYSIRLGTPAAKMKDQVDSNVKKQRVRELIVLSQSLSQDYAKNFENKTLKVLFEEYNSINKTATGHTTNYLKVVCENVEQDLTNTINDVKVVTSGFPLNYGIIIKQSSEED